MNDEEELYIRGEKHDKFQSTIGSLTRQLLTDIDFYDTMLPRIPVPVMKVTGVMWISVHPDIHIP